MSLLAALQQPPGCQPDVSSQLEAFCKTYEHLWPQPEPETSRQEEASDDTASQDTA